jgi:hypothetical protein
MRRKRISNIFEKKYTSKELAKHVSQQVDNIKFNEHCQQVAKNLNIDVVVVKDLLLNNSFVVLSLIQSSVLMNKVVKINITGYFSFVTTLIKYKITHLRAVTKGKTY